MISERISVERIKQREIKSGKPLSGKTVMITRPRADSGVFRRELEKLGAKVVEFPTIETKPVKDRRPLDKALRNISLYDFLVLTSQRGVRAVVDRIRALKLAPTHFSKTKVAAIGPATKGSLEQAGFKTGLVPSVFSSEGLLQTFRRKHWIRGKKFLLLRADIAPPYLRKSLEREGAEVTEIAVYETRKPFRLNRESARRIFSEKSIDFVIFLSSSAAKNFFGLFSGRRVKLETRYVSIGSVTSRTIRSFGARVDREAKVHTIPGVIQALIHSKGC